MSEGGIMGLFGWIKRSMGGGGGVGISMSVPADFTWEDQFLPINITLRGHKSEPRVVQQLNFTLRDNEEPESNDSSGPKEYVVDHPWTQDGPWELAAGQELVFELSMPLPFNEQDLASARGALSDAMPEGKMGKLVDGLFGLATQAPKHIRRYHLHVAARVEGAKLAATDGENLRYGGTFYKMPSQIKFGS